MEKVEKTEAVETTETMSDLRAAIKDLVRSMEQQIKILKEQSKATENEVKRLKRRLPIVAAIFGTAIIIMAVVAYFIARTVYG